MPRGHPYGLDAASTLIQIQARGLKTEIMIDARDREMRARLHVTGMNELFDCIITHETTRHWEPAPFRAALVALGTRPAEMVFVGDSLRRDIAPAQRLILFTVHAAYGGRNLDNSRDVVPDVWIEGIEELMAVLEGLQR